MAKTEMETEIRTRKLMHRNKQFFFYIFFQTVHLDPCLDDCVMFAKKLKGLGNEVGIDVLEGLPHGFLNFSLVFTFLVLNNLVLKFWI